MLRRLFCISTSVFTPTYKWLEPGNVLTTHSRFISQFSYLPGLQFKLGTNSHYPITVRMELKGRVMVYSILGCPHCMKAKNTLQELGLPYLDVSLDVYPHLRDDMQMRTGRKTVPQVFFNSHHVGGNDELQKLVSNQEELYALIEDVKNNEPPSDAPVPPDPSTAVADADPGEIVCEPDEYAQLVQALRESGLIKDHKTGLIGTEKKSFSGKEFVDWVVKTKGLDRGRAVEMGQYLIDHHFGHHVKSKNTFQDADVYYRLLDDDESKALNAGELSGCEPRPAGELGEEIRKLILKIYNAFLSTDGKKVNYQGIGGSQEFQRYVRLTKELHRVQLDGASREEKLAFFINIYNALVIHANVALGPPVNLWQRYKFFNTVKYIIGGYAYSLQDIENGVLRANRKGVGQFFSRPFSQSDPRLKVALERHEPLIHFALVCGAKSCPPIKTYSADGIYDQLSLAAAAFLEGPDGCQVDMKKKHIHLSQILKWYQEDFGRNKEEVVQWVCDHVTGEQQSQLKELLGAKNFKVSYMPYDWGVNSSK